MWARSSSSGRSTGSPTRSWKAPGAEGPGGRSERGRERAAPARLLFAPVVVGPERARGARGGNAFQMRVTAAARITFGRDQQVLAHRMEPRVAERATVGRRLVAPGA